MELKDMWQFRWMTHKKRGVRMLIVRMLTSGPKNGIELMNEIEKMTQGWWRPSPGSIYPVLKQLSDEGIVRKREKDGRYELTEKAESSMEWFFGPRMRKPRSVEETFDEVSGFVSYLEEALSADPGLAKEYKPKIKTLADRLSSLAKRGEIDG